VGGRVAKWSTTSSRSSVWSERRGGWGCESAKNVGSAGESMIAAGIGVGRSCILPVVVAAEQH
jgi:hypothetical protein